MIIKNIENVEKFLAIADSCKGEVTLTSIHGHRFNLKSKLNHPQAPRTHIQAQRSDVGSYRGISATCNQGQVCKDKIHHHAQGGTDTLVYLLLQPASMGQRTIQALSREQDTRELVLHRNTY